MTKERFRELMDPIIKGLFGKQLPYHLRKGDEDMPEIRPVGKIVSELCQLDDDSWSKYAFSREPLNGKFTDEQRIDLGRQANACGKEYAERLAEQCGTKDPVQMAQKLGLLVEYPLMPQNASRVLFAEYREPNKIFVYMDGVKKGQVLLKEPGVIEALGPNFNISKLLLGHELFHYVEEIYKKEIWTHTYRIKLWSIGPLCNRSTIVTLGEIAAMSFTKTLCGIPWSPYVMDSFLVYGYSPGAATALYEEMMGFAGKTP